MHYINARHRRAWRKCDVGSVQAKKAARATLYTLTFNGGRGVWVIAKMTYFVHVVRGFYCRFFIGYASLDYEIETHCVTTAHTDFFLAVRCCIFTGAIF